MPLMSSPVKFFALTSACAILLSACSNIGVPSANTTTNKVVAGAVKTVSIDLPSSSLFSVIGFDYKGTEDAKAAQQEFYGQAIPMAAEYGFTRHGTLMVSDVNVGDFKPQGFLMTSWPNQAAFDSFQDDARWPGFDALRPDIWHDIRYYRDVQEDGLKLTLSDDKFYTLAIAYLNPKNPGDYGNYLSSLKDEVESNGGKFILKLKDPKLESLSEEPSPDQLTFIEWNDASGVDRLLSSETYKSNRHLAGSGTTKFAFYRLKPSF